VQEYIYFFLSILFVQVSIKVGTILLCLLHCLCCCLLLSDTIFMKKKLG